MDRAPFGRLLRAGIGSILVLASASLNSGCEKPNTYAAPQAAEVSVAVPIRKAVVTSLEYTGSAAPTATVELRARVRGFLEEIKFKPGAHVKQGELLFVIDKKPFVAKVDQLKADMANKTALFESADSDLKRNIPLVSRKVISEQEYVTSKATRDAAKAAIDSAKALLMQADYDLGYTEVRAPIDGRISRNLVDKGNLVGDGTATLLATIVKDDPIYAYMSVSERDLLRFRSQVSQGERADYRTTRIPLDLGFSTEKGFPHPGRVDYADPAIDTRTGTVQARGIFDNPNGVIVPGSFVRIRVPLENLPDALLVPEEVVLLGPKARPYLLLVNDKNKVEQRWVTIGSVVDGLQVITDGLKPDDLVVINNLQRARPGLDVKPSKTTIADYLKQREASAESLKAKSNPGSVSAAPVSPAVVAPVTGASPISTPAKSAKTP